MTAASKAPAEKDTRRMMIEIPTIVPALRPAVANCDSVSHPGSICKNAVTTYVWHLQKSLYHGKRW